MRYYFLMITIIIAVVSCGGNKVLILYEGERKPIEDVATIEIDNVYLMSIDTLHRKYQAFSEVLPGQHSISVNYNRLIGNIKRVSSEPIVLTFNAERGHKYLVKARSGLHFWTSWIFDLANDSLVAGSTDFNDKDHRGYLK